MKHEAQERQFRSWLTSHKGILVKVTRAYALDESDREDLLQEIAIQLWRSIPNFGGKAKASTWVYKVALYTAMSWSRRERVHREGHEALEPIADALEAHGADDARLRWLYAQISLLKPLDRSVILLVLEGFRQSEIAEMLGLSESHVGVKVHRIKKELSERSREVSSHGVR